MSRPDEAIWHMIQRAMNNPGSRLVIYDNHGAHIVTPQQTEESEPTTEFDRAVDEVAQEVVRAKHEAREEARREIADLCSPLCPFRACPTCTHQGGTDRPRKED